LVRGSPPVTYQELGRARLLADFQAVEDNELSCGKGDVVMLVMPSTGVPVGWLHARLGSRFGLVPASYVERVHDALHDEEASRASFILPSEASQGSDLLSGMQPLAKRNERGRTARQTELRTRVRVLSERDERTWGLKEMRAALSLGGSSAHKGASKPELVRATYELIARERVRQEEEEAAEAEAERARAEAAERAEAQLAIKRKFRSRGAAWASPREAALASREAGLAAHAKPGHVTFQEAAAKGQTTFRSDISASSYGGTDDTPRGGADSTRAKFRARGAAAARGGVSEQADPEAEAKADETTLSRVGDTESAVLVRKLQQLLVPEGVQGTLWAHSVNSLGQCMLQQWATVDRI